MHERYAGLRERLMADGGAEVALDFDDFAVFLLGGLPLSALRDAGWWTNSDGDPSRSQAHAWLDAGYEVEFVDLGARTVLFRRRG